MDKQKAIGILNRLIELTFPLHSLGIASPSFEHWRNDASAHIADIFGRSSDHFQNFTKIAYIPSEDYFDLVETSFRYGYTSQKQERLDLYEQAFGDALRSARKSIRSMLKDLQDNQEYTTATSESATVDAEEVITMPEPTTDQKNVFVVHGRNIEARDGLFSFLRAIGLRPLEWTQLVKETGKGSPYIGEILDAAFSTAQAIVVLITPDDEARLQKHLRQQSEPSYEVNLTPQARPNVIFEAGMAMGRNPNRTILVELGESRPFSDIVGRHVIRMNNSTATRQALAQRLEQAGCAVDLNGVDWHTVGNFKITKSATLPQVVLPLSEGTQPQQSKPPPEATTIAVNQLKSIGVQADFGVKLVKAGLTTNEELKAALDTYVNVYFYDPRIHGLDPTRVDLEHTTANINLITGEIG